MNSQKLTLTERKRLAIIDAAIEEFHECGFQGSSMDKISARAQVSKRTVYNHFASKEVLFSEIMAQVWEKALAATCYPYSKTAPLATQLYDIAMQETALLRSEAHMRMSRLVIAECFHSADMVQQNLAKLSVAESGLIVWLKAAQEDGRLKPLDYEMASTQFIGLIKSFAFWPQVITQAPQLDDAATKAIVESSVSMFLKQYQA